MDVFPYQFASEKIRIKEKEEQRKMNFLIQAHLRPPNLIPIFPFH